MSGCLQNPEQVSESMLKKKKDGFSQTHFAGIQLSLTVYLLGALAKVLLEFQEVLTPFLQAKGHGVPWLVWNRFSILVPVEDLKSKWSLTQHTKGSFR